MLKHIHIIPMAAKVSAKPFELQHILNRNLPADCIPIEYYNGCPGRGAQPQSYNIFLILVFQLKVFLQSIPMAAQVSAEPF